MELEKLVRSARQGDRAAFGHIVRRFQDVAFAGAFSRLGDVEEARDAAQDAFLEAWEQLHRLRQPAAFPGWFRRIVIKQVDRQLRRRRAREPEAVLENLPWRGPDPLALVEAGEIREIVRAAIASLPEHQRLPLSLFHLDGYRQKDVAAFLELSVSTVKKRIFDARRSLQERILKMVDRTVDHARPSLDDSFARRVDFWLAFQAHDLSAMARLLDEDPTLMQATSDWESAPSLRSSGWDVTAVTWAAYLGHAQMLTMLLDRGGDANQSGHNGDAPLLVAVMNGQAETVHVLLDRGADVDRQGSCRHTALHRAVIGDDQEMCELLIGGGADLEAGDYRDRTPADWAALKGHGELLEWLVSKGGRPTDLPLRRSRRADVARDVPLVLETGIKALDLVAPFPRGDHVLLAGGLGNGHLLLLQQAARNVIETYDARVVYVGSVNDDVDEASHVREWSGYGGDGRLMQAHCTHVLIRQDQPERYPEAVAEALTLADGLRRDGHDVLLYVETPIALADGVLPMLRSQTGHSPEAAITVCYVNGFGRHINDGPFAFVDALARMDIRRSQAGLYPAIDLERSTSRLIGDPRLEESHRAAVADAQVCFRVLAANRLPTPEQLLWVSPDDRTATEALFARAVRLDRFLTQPYHGTEMWTGEPGETVALADTVEGVRQILSGKHDSVAEEAFLNVGTISQALEKAERL